MSQTQKSFANSRVTLAGPTYVKDGTNYKAHLSIKPPASGAAQGKVYALIFDLSGSMDEDACQIGDEATKYHTRMDMQKMAAELMVKMLLPEDTLSIVIFHSNAYILMEPTLMNADGRARAFRSISQMRSEGATNIWDALRVTHGIMSRPEFSECLRCAIMLTDGCESMGAQVEGGTIGAFTRMPRSFVLYTLGFGSGVNSEMLGTLASVSGGRFSNIADFTTLATTTINTLATVMATCSTNVPVTVTYDDGTTSQHDTSLIQFGQDRNIVFKSLKKPVSASVCEVSEPFTEGCSLMALARHDVLDAISTAVATNSLSNTYAQVHTTYTTTPVEQDVSECDPTNGELVKACASPDVWRKWGQNYTIAYRQALLNDHRMNFKEKGQARLGGAVFEQYKSKGDEIFDLIPLPPANGRLISQAIQYPSAYTQPAPRAVANVASTNNPENAGGCWSPGSMVLMADGSRKAIERVEPDDLLWSTTGVTKVDYVLQLGTYQPTQNMCRVGNLLLTWYHPVCKDGLWVPACAVAPFSAMPVPDVYNLLCTGGSVLDIDGVLTVSLGHELQDAGVKHDFFGSRAKVLDAIRHVAGFDTRRVVFKNLVPVRDPLTNEITGWNEMA